MDVERKGAKQSAVCLQSAEACCNSCCFLAMPRACAAKPQWRPFIDNRPSIYCTILFMYRDVGSCAFLASWLLRVIILGDTQSTYFRSINSSKLRSQSLIDLRQKPFLRASICSSFCPQAHGTPPDSIQEHHPISKVK